MNNLKQYDKYIKAYNDLADKLDILGVNDEIFSELNNLCTMALNIDPDMLSKSLREKQESLA